MVSVDPDDMPCLQELFAYVKFWDSRHHYEIQKHICTNKNPT